MAKKTVVLTDVQQGTWLDSFELRESADLELRGAGDWSIRKRTLHGGVSEGVDVVSLNNGALSASILPTRGMGLWRGSFRGIEIGWQSPVKHPVNPCYVNLTERNGLGWLAGFNELLCRCGLASNGAPCLDVSVDAAGDRAETPLTLHGKIANTPAHHVEVEVDSEGEGVLRVRGIVDEAMMFGTGLRLTATYETVPGSNRLKIRDEISNIAARPMELELLYHTNVGRPFLDQGAKLVLPIRVAAPHNAHSAKDIETWDTYLPPTPGYFEQCYFFELLPDQAGRTTVLLRNAAGDRGISLEYTLSQLPWFTVWKCTQQEADGYVTGLEPGTDFPNPKTFERTRGRVITLQPGQTHSTSLDLVIHAGQHDVAAAEAKIADLQRRAERTVHKQPIAEYSPGA